MPGRAREDHTGDAGIREPADLVGGERLAGDLDERFGAPARSVAKPLGLPAGEDDRLHQSAAVCSEERAVGDASHRSVTVEETAARGVEAAAGAEVIAGRGTS